MARDFAKHLPFPEAEGRKKKGLKADSLSLFHREENWSRNTRWFGKEQKHVGLSRMLLGDRGFAKGQEMGGGQWVAGEVPSQGFKGTMPTGETILRLYWFTQDAILKRRLIFRNRGHSEDIK